MSIRLQAESEREFSVADSNAEKCEFNGNVVLIKDDVHVGRGKDQDLVLTNPHVSRRHCNIFKGIIDRWFIDDLGSTNQTKIDRGGKIMVVYKKKPLLKEGDIILLGDQVKLKVL